METEINPLFWKRFLIILLILFVNSLPTFTKKDCLSENGCVDVKVNVNVGGPGIPKGNIARVRALNVPGASFDFIPSTRQCYLIPPAVQPAATQWEVCNGCIAFHKSETCGGGNTYSIYPKPNSCIRRDVGNGYKALYRCPGVSLTTFPDLTALTSKNSVKVKNNRDCQDIPPNSSSETKWKVCNGICVELWEKDDCSGASMEIKANIDGCVEKTLAAELKGKVKKMSRCKSKRLDDEPTN